MPESAIPTLTRREKAARHISMCALKLTAERGFEGFTMEDLAQAAGVSRRTLFNYFDSKLDAVLGPDPELTPELTAEFRAGGPSGHLMADLGTLAHEHFERMPGERESIALTRQVMHNPRILAASHSRFERLAAAVLAIIEEREGAQYDPLKAKVALGMLMMLCHVALENFLDDVDEHSFTHYYDEALSATQALLA